MGEGLVRRDLGRSKKRRAYGQIERVAMPVQLADAVDRAEGRGLAFLGESHLVPAELLPAAGIDARREHGCERLAAETNTDGGNVLLHRRLDDGEFLLQQRIAVDLVDADRTAEHEEEVGRLGGVEIVDAGFESR